MSFGTARLYAERYTIKKIYYKLLSHFRKKGFHPWPATNSHRFCGIKSRR